MNSNKENKVVIQPPSIILPSWKMYRAARNNNKLESKSPVMKAKSEVPKETTSKGDGHMSNENYMSHQEQDKSQES